ncbi:hypothetical protein JCM19992_05610 [Thermostilla marina]
MAEASPLYVEIAFDCLPLRTVARLDPPLDASPAFLALFDRVVKAIEKHGRHNTYYLHHATCVFHLTNDPQIGMLEFAFEGCVMTDSLDRQTIACDLDISLKRDTCDWANARVIEWFHETVRRAVMVEFDRYIAAGDLQRAIERLERLEKEADEHGGYLGLGL